MSVLHGGGNASAKNAVSRGGAVLASPLEARLEDLGPVSGRVAMYCASGPAGAAEERPLLLIHSVNAAASAFEVKPLFDHCRGRRPVYAIDLPGFGQSDRSDRFYSVRMMTDAVLLTLSEICRLHGTPVDAIALSLSCEFLARAAIEAPDSLATLGFISPTGFEAVARDDKEGTRGKKWLHGALHFPLWRRSLFKLLTTKAVIRHPVWMIRGSKGDFVDYHHVSRVKNRPNWTFGVFQTGAFPHFEALAQVTSSYDTFLSNATHLPT